MADEIAANLKKLGIILPEAAAPVANYVGWVKTGNLIFTSGQLPLENGKVNFVGKLGEKLKIEDGQAAAKLCAINILSQLNNALKGDLEKIVRCVKLVGFVNATPDFTDHPQVINGASDFMVAALGDRGRHARSAVGVGSLPRGVAVEVEGIFEVH